MEELREEASQIRAAAEIPNSRSQIPEFNLQNHGCQEFPRRIPKRSGIPGFHIWNLGFGIWDREISDLRSQDV
jgi:hypothetical protein